jgi:hypothetical protein
VVDLVPVAIRRPTGPAAADHAFVASLSDVVASADVYRNLQSAEAEYRDAITRWKETLRVIASRRSDPVLRWRLAEEIRRYERRMRTAWRLYPSNLLEAVSRDIGISDSALGYILLFRERFTLSEVKAAALGWSKFQELLDIKDDREMRKCLKLVKRGRLRFDHQIRDFKRRANAANR